jgi:hypothetical protein
VAVNPNNYGITDSRVHHGGKGDRPRSIDKKKFDENYDKIFKKDKKGGSKSDSTSSGK